MSLEWKIRKFEELSLGELYEIMRVRSEVFIVEQKLSYVDCDDYDQKATHLFAWENSRVVAYMRIFAPGSKYLEASFGRVLTVKKHRGQGTGKTLTAKGIEYLKKSFPDASVKISAQAYLKKFYENFGFQTIGKEYLEEGIPHVKMTQDFKS